MFMTTTRTSIPSDSADLGALLQSLWGFIPQRVITIALDEGLFDALSEAGMPLDEVATRLAWHPRSAAAVVELLHALGLTTAREGRVELSEQGRKWFAPDSPYSVRPYFDRLARLRKTFDTFEVTLRSGQPSAEVRRESQKAFGEDAAESMAFALTMRSAALQFGPAFVDAMGEFLPAESSFDALDVGCGPGALSLLLAEKYPLANFVLFDLPLVADIAKTFVRGSMRDRVQVRASDWAAWNWQERSWDLVILSQVLHERPRDEARALFAQAARALRVGGYLAVVLVGDITGARSGALHQLFALVTLAEIGGDNPTASWLDEIAATSHLEACVARDLGAGRSLWLGRRSAGG
jgi:SAM-dependent methyltransferase